jgi:antitoxin component YwqK of YwqJK toxin-antitoxin module
MKFSILFFITSLFLFSCSTETLDKDKLVDGGSIMNSTTLDTCLCEELFKDSTGFLFKDANKFTGVCRYNYPNSTDKYIVKNILEGKLHGTVVYYARTGEELMKENYQNGEIVRTGEDSDLSCDCLELVHVAQSNGNASKVAMLADKPFTGTCFKYYPETAQKYIEISYTNGIQDGYSSYYDKAGKTMYIEKYEEGELIQTIHHN